MIQFYQFTVLIIKETISLMIVQTADAIADLLTVTVFHRMGNI